MKLKTKKNECGIALIVVLWIMVLMMVIVTEFAHSMKTEVNITRNFKEDMEAYYLAKAGINLAIAEILQDVKYHYIKKDKLIFGEDVNPKRDNIKLGNGEISYKIIDEERKLDISSADKEILKNFFKIIGADAEIVSDSILDWRDADTLYRENGAEDDYYKSQAMPYGSKDSSFDALEELFLIKGIDKLLLSQKTENKKGKANKVLDFLTITGSKVNLNTAFDIVLKSIYGEEKADKIIEEREQKGGIYSLSEYSNTFTVISTGHITNSPVKRHIKAIIKKTHTNKHIGYQILAWNDNFIKENN